MWEKRGYQEILTKAEAYLDEPFVNDKQIPKFLREICQAGYELDAVVDTMLYVHLYTIKDEGLYKSLPNATYYNSLFMERKFLYLPFICTNRKMMKCLGIC